MDKETKKLKTKILLVSALNIIVAVAFFFAPIIMVSFEDASTNLSPLEVIQGSSSVIMNGETQTYCVDFLSKDVFDFFGDVILFATCSVVMVALSLITEYCVKCKQSSLVRTNIFKYSLPLKITGNIKNLTFFSFLLFLWLQKTFAVPLDRNYIVSESAVSISPPAINFFVLAIGLAILFLPTMFMSSRLLETIQNHFEPKTKSGGSKK